MIRLRNLRSILAVAGTCAALSAGADGIAWPADFWQQVTNSINAAAQPVVQTSAAKQGFSSRVSAESTDALGTAEAPFDSQIEIFWCGSFLLDSTAPGMVLLFR